MADWHMMVADTNGSIDGELNTAITRQFTWMLTDACTASFTMDAMEVDAKYIQEVFTDLMVYRGNTLMFRGRIMSSQDTIGEAASNITGGTSPDTHTVDITATDYRGMLGHRFIHDYPPHFKPPAYKNIDQCTIAWDLIEASMDLPGGNWGIQKGFFTPSIQRTQTPPAGTYIDEAVNNLSLLDGGFEWEISPNMHFNTWPQPRHGANPPPGGYRGRGQDIGALLTYGDNVTNVVRTLNASTGQPYANVVRLTGSFNQPKGGSKTYDVTTEGIYGGTFPTAGRWEYEVSNSNLTTVREVVDATKWELVRDANLTPTYQLTLTQGWWDPSILWLGDIVTVTINHGRINESLSTRVTQMDVFLGDVSSEEIVQVTCGPRYTSMVHRILSHDRIITQISKTAG